ncbi:MAG: tetratricopeptide repeat protein, partial [Gammaproteobacteria bacterium]
MSNVSDLLIRAVALHKAGQVAAAESAYRDILAEAPRHPDALNLLGMLLSGRGEYPEALALLRESLRVRPAHPGTSHNLANALQAAGDLSGAIDQHRQTLRMAPDHPGALYSLGHALLQTGDSGAAVEVLRRSVAVSPGHAAPHVALGAALSESGDAVSAVEAYRRALEIEPDRPGVLNDLGNTLRASGAIDAAIAAYRDALRLAPDEAGYHHNLALALRDGARLQEAIDAFTRALELQPDRVDTRGDLARLLEITNRVAEARDMTVEGLGHAPGDLLLNLVAAKCERRAGALDDAAGRLERMLDQTLPASWEVQFRFELGRVEDARKRSTEAFQAFRRGNALMLDEWQRENGESNAFFDYVQRQEERLAGPWSNGWAPVRVADGRRDPVFLVGFPRSGTTLLDQILDSHPEILVLEERPTIDRIEEELWDEDPGLLETLPDWNGALIERLRRRYFEVVDALGNGPHPGVLVDKMPLNSAKAALICRLFPQARFIFA